MSTTVTVPFPNYDTGKLHQPRKGRTRKSGISTSVLPFVEHSASIKTTTKKELLVLASVQLCNFCDDLHAYGLRIAWGGRNQSLEVLAIIA